MRARILVNELGEPELWLEADSSTERFALSVVASRLGLAKDPVTHDYVLMPQTKNAQ